MEMGIGNEYIKAASLLAVGVFLLACYSYTSGALLASNLASVGQVTLQLDRPYSLSQAFPRSNFAYCK